MNNHILLLFFFINVMTVSLFSVDEVNTLPSVPSPPLGSLQSSLPQLNIDYDALAPFQDTNRSEYSQTLLDFEPDSSSYCPSTEILTKILNELRLILPQSSDKIKNILSHFYVTLQNALNSNNNVEYINALNSKKYFNYIDSLTQKLKLMDDKNVKIKISFEHEIPRMSKTICDKLCNDLVHFANAGNSVPTNNLNNAYERGKIKNNIMTFLQNYRPDYIYSNSQSNIKFKNQFPTLGNIDYFYPSNSKSLPINIMPPNVPILNPSQPLSHPTRTTISDSSQNFVPLPKSPPLSSVTGTSNLISLKNVAAFPQKSDIGDSNLPKYFPPVPNISKNLNSYALKNLVYQHPSPIGNEDSATYFKEHPFLDSIGTTYNYPFQHFIPIPKQPSNSDPLTILAPPLKDLKGYNKSSQNAAPLPQNPTRGSRPVQIVLPQVLQLTENAEDIEVFAKKLDEKKQKQMQYNKGNAVQYIGKNNQNIVTPKKSDYPILSMFPNSWGQSNYISASNNNNEKLLQEKMIQLYKQRNPQVSNLIMETTKLNPPNFYQNVNTNSLSNIKQYERGKLEMDSLLAQANSLDHYNQHLQSVKNLLNPETGQFLNRQISHSSLNFDPMPYGNNNALYNSYLKNINQLATQSYIPIKPVVFPNSYYYYNSNLGITNSAKNTRENYSDQFLDLQRLLTVSNLDKLNSVSNKNGIVELTYKLNQSKPLVEPYYYVKYRLPYDLFLFNLKKLLSETPSLRNQPHKLYKDLLIGSNITASSSDLKSLNKDELLRLVSTNGTLVTAKVLDADDNTANEQIKIVQQLNANMPLEDIVRTDANITKVADLTSNIPIMNYRLNYLNDLQRKMPVNRYYSNLYNTQANQNYYQNVQNPNLLANKMLPLGYNTLQNLKNYPYYTQGINPFSRYYGHGG